MHSYPLVIIMIVSARVTVHASMWHSFSFTFYFQEIAAVEEAGADLPDVEEGCVEVFILELHDSSTDLIHKDKFPLDKVTGSNCR